MKKCHWYDLCITGTTSESQRYGIKAKNWVDNRNYWIIMWTEFDDGKRQEEVPIAFTCEKALSTIASDVGMFIRIRATVAKTHNEIGFPPFTCGKAIISSVR